MLPFYFDHFLFLSFTSSVWVGGCRDGNWQEERKITFPQSQVFCSWPRKCFAVEEIFYFDLQHLFSHSQTSLKFYEVRFHFLINLTFLTCCRLLFTRPWCRHTSQLGYNRTGHLCCGESAHWQMLHDIVTGCEGTWGSVGEIHEKHCAELKMMGKCWGKWEKLSRERV